CGTGAVRQASTVRPRSSRWDCSLAVIGKGPGSRPRKGYPLLRRKFSINVAVRRARLYVSGLGYCELSINGKKMGDRVLEPASTYYNNDQPFKLGSRVLYSTYD